jgi:hypothetical protein
VKFHRLPGVFARYVETCFISECRDTQHYGLDDRDTLVYHAVNLTENLGPNQSGIRSQKHLFMVLEPKIKHFVVQMAFPGVLR